MTKALQTDAFMAWRGQLPPGCEIAIEACGGVHHWARKLTSLGFDARLIAAIFVTPYRMQGNGGKNDANDRARPSTEGHWCGQRAEGPFSQ